MFSTDIDHYLNPITPYNRLNSLPAWISWWFGCRHQDHPVKHISEPWIWLWSSIGAFCGVTLLEGVFQSNYFFLGHGAPIIVGSYGASAILLYNAIESPLSQPRNVFFGQLVSASSAVAITKLFLLHSPSTFEDPTSLRWLAGGITCAVSSSLMGLTKTVHPPAGATALLAAVDPTVRGMGWYLLPVVMLSSVLVIAVACVVNNVQRRYPVYWWTAEDLRTPRRTEIEEGISHGVKAGEDEKSENGGDIIVGLEGIEVPKEFWLADEERDVLRILHERLRESSTRTEVERRKGRKGIESESGDTLGTSSLSSGDGIV